MLQKSQIWTGKFLISLGLTWSPPMDCNPVLTICFTYDKIVVPLKIFGHICSCIQSFYLDMFEGFYKPLRWANLLLRWKVTTKMTCRWFWMVSSMAKLCVKTQHCQMCETDISTMDTYERNLQAQRSPCPPTSLWSNRLRRMQSLGLSLAQPSRHHDTPEQAKLCATPAGTLLYQRPPHPWLPFTQNHT